MPNELRENLIDVFARRGHRGSEIVEEVKEILSLIESERCVWTYDSEREWVTSCGNEVLDEATYGQYPFCPCCGKRIEVQDGRG